MPRLKSLRNCPPAGFQYRQKETGWQLESWDFQELCNKLQEHRRANPKFKLELNMDSIRAEVDETNALRVMRDFPAGIDEYVRLSGGTSPPIASLSPRHWPGSAAAGIKKVSDGAKLLVEWLGSGASTVLPELAESRAKICSNCPKNGKGDWTSFFTVLAADSIKKTLEIRHQMELSTSVDDQLGVCSVCLCPMKLKVHAPIGFINSILQPEQISQFDPVCWIPKEVAAL